MLHYSDVTCVNAAKRMQIQTLLVYKQKIKDISNTLSKENHSEFCLQDAAKHIEINQMLLS